MTRAQANHLLDFVRAGGLASDADVLWALWVTGEFEMFSTQKSTHEKPRGNSEINLEVLSQ